MPLTQPPGESPIERDFHHLVCAVREVKRVEAVNDFIDDVLNVALDLEDVTAPRGCPDGLRGGVAECTLKRGHLVDDLLGVGDIYKEQELIPLCELDHVADPVDGERGLHPIG